MSSAEKKNGWRSCGSAEAESGKSVFVSISKRLKYIAGLVSPGCRVVDVGTDHGYVPVFLLREGICPRAIAVDVSPDSLQKAVELAKRAGLEDCMACRLSDGLQKVLPGEVDAIVISGMGGILMRRILDDGLETVLAARELILSPHRNPELIEEFLELHGFAIVADEVIEDKKRCYRVMKAVNSHLDR